MTTLCPTGTERLEQLLTLIESGKVDLTPLFTHTMALDEIVRGYEMFENHDDGVIKIALS